MPAWFSEKNEKDKEINFNYHDSKVILNLLKPFMLSTFLEQLDFGINKKIAYCFGNNKNYKYLNTLNKKHKFFIEIVPLEHPRYIIQYKSKQIDSYIYKYLQAFAL